MKNIIVLSKLDAIQFQSDSNYAFISISHENNFPKLMKERCLGILQLQFYDMDVCHEESWRSYLFQERQAKEIFNFIDSLSSQIESLIVHCELGRSRSPAVAAALSKVYFQDDSAWFKFPYVPNMLVYRTILNFAADNNII